MEAVPRPADPVRSAHARRNPTPWNKGGATARENSPYRSHIAPLAGQNSPCARKMAQFCRFYPSRANFIPLSPAASRAGRTLYRMRAGCGASKHNSTPGAAGVEGAGGTAGPGRHHPAPKAPPAWRAPEGPEGTGGLRDRPLRAVRLACGDLAGGRALRRPEHPWSHKHPGPVTRAGRRPRAHQAARPSRARKAPGPTAHHAAPQETQHRGAGPQARAPRRYDSDAAAQKY